MNRIMALMAAALAFGALSAAPPDPGFPGNVPGSADYRACPAKPAFLAGDSLKYRATALLNGASDVVARDSLIYLAVAGGLKILDGRDLTGPPLISEIPVSHGRVTDMVVRGNLVYLTAFDGCLYVIDVSDPQNPFKIDTVLIPPANGIDIKDSVACVVYSEDSLGMLLLDISNPAHVDIVSNTGLSHVPNKVLIHNDYAIAVGVEGLTVIDLKTSPPVIHGQVTLVPEYSPVDLNMVNDTLLALAGMDWMYPERQQSAVLLYNLADPANPAYAGQVDYIGLVGDVEIWGNLAFVANGDYGLKVLDLTDPSNPQKIGSFPATDYAARLWVDDTLLYLVDFGDYFHGAANGFKSGGREEAFSNQEVLPGGLQILNVSDPANPALLGYHNLIYPGTVTNVYTASGKVVGLNNTGIDPGLWLIQWSDTMEVYACTTLNPPRDAKSIGDILYLATETGLEIRDFDPGLALIGNYDVFPDFGYSIDVQGDYAYVAGVGGFKVFNISNPAVPDLVAERYIVGKSRISARGNYLYIAFVNIIGPGLISDILVYDISNPENPDSILMVDHPGIFNGIDVGEKLCAKADIGAYVFDITDPVNPVFEDSVYVSWGRDISLSGLTLYIPTAWFGLNVYDISGANVELISVRETPGAANNVFAGDSLLAIADRWGIEIYDYQQPSDVNENDLTIPADFALYQNHPNPFNPTTDIGFYLPRATHVSLTVYNVLGQRVRSLLEDKLPAGEHRIQWDGKDSRGVEVSSGIYFYRITIANHVSEAKAMVLLR